MIETRSKDLHIRNEKEEQLAEKADRLSSQIEVYAAKNDETGEFPFASFQLLKDAGVLGLTIPRAYGGEEASLYETIIVLERIAKGDGSVALSVGWHLCLFINYRHSQKWEKGQFSRICKDVIEKGEVLNIFATEKNGGNIFRGSKPETIARRTATGFELTGEKTFATLAPIANPFIVIAWIEEKGVLGEFLVRKNENVELIETWNTIGMRSTGSHNILFHDVQLPADSLLSIMDGKGGSRNRATFLFIAAVFLGVSHAARDFILDYTVNHRSNSLQASISDVPHVQQKIGEIEVLLTSSRMLLYSLADKWDQAQTLADREQLFKDFQAAKYIICHQAIKIVELAMQIAGGRALSKDFKLERLFRDVQCGFPMHPADDMIIGQLAKEAILLYKEA
ncbi:acyl-CoA dehydrogenase family protein [Cytobacillus purgationiresistens]|uniref:Alkylation response protein AidB-like acyl-CoA dehydrogenase n=1 Tax=Cytobacillus purgationiresistens TaxID=863449 RepID=A0ABU0ADK5_9BACI|nr:acyl-CoA dehydrogenase family protein [Cytobacillus purgationiresistens]MDQ0268821.1 alkylation response protein AidB-like acyl-CoA dehydrogenase [Cytobacillus purgationiresistens]